MNQEERRQDYLRKAVEADELAKKAAADEQRFKWERIAAAYRLLAKQPTRDASQPDGSK